jgi:Tol biopolymer transport system component
LSGIAGLVVEGTEMAEVENSRLPEEPLQIPGYDLLDLIGVGGMGEVHRATQLSLQRPVAVKFLRSLGDDQARLSAFNRESRLMAALAHPHVVTIHDCGEIHQRHYLIMEYVDGSTLRAQMQPGCPWPREKAVEVLEAIAQGLSYIHDQGILHLDLKPENVLCTRTGAIKISDFGLAAPHVASSSSPDAGISQGTIDYCAPEQRHGLPVDERSDVFSLATLAYELLTGELPSRVYVPASSRNPKLPRAVDEVLRRGLARDADERFGTVKELRRALMDVLGIWPAPRVRRWPLLAGCAAILIAAGFVALSGSGREQEAPVAGPTVRPAPYLTTPLPGMGELLFPCIQEGDINLFLFDLTTGDARRLTADRDQNTDPSWSPDGKRIAFVKNRGSSDIYVMDADGANVTQLTHGEGLNRTPAWSPDGRRIVFATDRDGNWEIYVMEADGSMPTNLSRNPGYDADPAWSPDGTEIAFTSQREDQKGFRPFIMNSNGDNARALSQTDNPAGNVYPAWSPDGTRIAYAEGFDSGLDLVICARDGSQQKRLTRLGGLVTRPTWSPDSCWIAFQRQKNERYLSVHVVDVNGGTPIEILKTEGQVEGSRPVWRPR